MADAQAKTAASPLLSLLALGNFVVGMGVFVVIGIVTPIAEGLGISKADAGIVLTSYAIAYALLSPVGAALTGSLPRRTVLVAALGLFCVGSLLSAVSTSLLHAFFGKPWTVPLLAGEREEIVVVTFLRHESAPASSRAARPGRPAP